MIAPGAVVTFGESMMLLATPGIGALAHATSTTVRIGGAESNVAIALQRLGTPAVWMSRLGADSAGDLVERQIRAEGVTVIAERDPDAPTGLMLKERRTPALTRVSYHRAASAASRATVSDLDEDAIRAAALLHLTGITPALSDSARALTLHAARVAREAAVPVSFDLNYRSALWSRPRARDCFRTLIPLADVVFAGEDEAALALDRSPDDVPSLAEGLASMGPSEAVIKRGAKGAFARVDGRSFEQDAVRIDPIDTVGAGDAFVAGYLAERLNGVSVPERLETAVAVAAFVCLSEADWEGSPRRAEQAQLTPEDPVAR